ncbi:MAG: DUF2513 domain-containing protein [Novosphingobium sp.]
MKRDFDLIREILLHVEQTAKPLSPEYYYHFEHEDRDGVANSLQLMADKGLIEAEEAPVHGAHPSDWYAQVRLTWDGCDFLDSIRDDEIWKKTKAGASAAGGFTFDLLKALAKGLIKKKIETHTGVNLDI